MSGFLVGRVVGVVTPAYDGLLWEGYVSSLLGLRELVGSLGGRVWWGCGSNLANHVRMRNALVVEGLAAGVTDFLIVDSDIEYRPEDVVWMLERDLGVVGGVPRVNRPVSGLPFAFRAPASGQLVVEGGLMRVLGLPTAFLLVKAGVFGVLEEGGLAPEYDDNGELRREWFVAGAEDGHFWGEDIRFCRKCEEAGVEVWAAPGVPLVHRKSVSLEGTLLDFMRDNWGEAVES